VGPAQGRTEKLQQFGVRQKFDLNYFRQSQELRQKLVMEAHVPAHFSMPSKE
jgi:hypothetical protein